MKSHETLFYWSCKIEMFLSISDENAWADFIVARLRHELVIVD